MRYRECNNWKCIRYSGNLVRGEMNFYFLALGLIIGLVIGYITCFLDMSYKIDQLKQENRFLWGEIKKRFRN